ncbi:hypothetical protein CKF54_06855 [Psittacicella hinzii]|uniref:Uncharacterized protein n=1 Tax=Psittacicella hinzii TaxID=2028575 RepID=A0A3A1Y222_9GAMM|nr:uroporphyrinogen-III C-methyltransferase [Psittacicella hinzii]RIY31336.1 hypothetical protein CKF54_06855 [Psittacicella hinzii]
MFSNNNANFPTEPEKKPVAETTTEEQQTSSEQQEPTSPKNSKREQQRSQRQEPPIIIEPPKYRFLGLMAVLALGLSGFAVYKMYEPSIFSTADLEATSSKFVSVNDFNTFKNSTQQEIEILKIKYNILQQQFDSRFNSTSSTFDRSFGSNTSSSGSSSANFNSSNLSSSNINRILDNYVTVANLNETISTFNNNIQAQLNSLGTRVTSLEQQQVNNTANAPAANTSNNNTSTTTPNLPPPVPGISAEQVQGLINQATTSEAFKTYIGSLIAEYVAQNPSFTEQDRTNLTRDIGESVASQVFNRLVTQLQGVSADLTKQINEQLPAAINNGIKREQSALLQSLYAHVNSVLTQQILTQVQAQIKQNASLTNIITNLQITASLAPNDKVKAAIETDINNLSHGTQSTNSLVNQLISLVNNVSSLPQLNQMQLEKAQDAQDSSFGKATKEFFSKFVQVQKVGDLPATNLNLYIQENLKLNLQNAIIAIGANNTAEYRNSLDTLVKVVTTVYPQDNKVVQDFVNQVKALSEVNFSYNANYQLGSLNLFAASNASDNQPSKPAAQGQKAKPAAENKPASSAAQQGQKTDEPAQPAQPASDKPAN